MILSCGIRQVLYVQADCNHFVNSRTVAVQQLIVIFRAYYKTNRYKFSLEDNIESKKIAGVSL